MLCGVCAAYTRLPSPTLIWLCVWNLGLGDASLCLFVVTLQLLSGGTSESGAPNNQPICECDDRCPSEVAALDDDDVAVASDIAKVIATHVAVVATDSIITIRHYHKGQYHNICGLVAVSYTHLTLPTIYSV